MVLIQGVIMNAAIVDRIEGNNVVIVIGNKSLIKPISLFPSNLREGDVVDLETFQILRRLTENRRNEARELLKKIFRN